jgi:hypothetical protein
MLIKGAMTEVSFLPGKMPSAERSERWPSFFEASFYGLLQNEPRPPSHYLLGSLIRISERLEACMDARRIHNLRKTHLHDVITMKILPRPHHIELLLSEGDLMKEAGLLITLLQFYTMCYQFWPSTS